MDFAIGSVLVAVVLFIKWRLSLKQKKRKDERLSLKQRINAGIYACGEYYDHTWQDGDWNQ